MSKIKIIEAGAGSGKTYRLTKEVYKAITREGKDRVRPNGFILTTFTRKAAAELINRVSQELITEGKRDEAHLIRQSLIGTVNSVCGNLINRFAFDAGISLTMQVMPEGEDQVHFNKALTSVTTQSDLDRFSILSEMLSIEDKRSRKKADWRSHVKDVVNHARTNCVKSSQLSGWADKSIITATGFLPKTDGDQSVCIKEARKALVELEKIVAGGKDTTKTTISAVDTLKTFLRKADSNFTPCWQDFYKLAGLTAGKRSGADDILHNLKLQAGSHHTWPEFKESIAEYIRLVFDVAARAMDAYAAWKNSEELMDFIDQEVMALNLLDIPRVQQVLREELDMVLVDEFQDTSPIQLALFLKLSECAKESIWVGDPKQAIYGFRNADPELMFAAVESISNEDGGKHLDRLDTSYRSVGPLVDFVNDTFEKAFESQNIPRERVRLIPHRTEKPLVPSLESWVIDAKNISEDAAAIAVQIAKILTHPESHLVYDKGQKTSRPIQPKDIAVLCRLNDDCDIVAEQLTAQNINVERAANGLLALPEVSLILAGYKLLVDSKDTLAAAKITYLTDVVKSGNSEERWLETRLSEVSTQEVGKHVTGWNTHPIIKRILDKSVNIKNMTPRSTLQAAADLVNVWDFIKHQENPAQCVANVSRLMAYAMEYEDSCLASRNPVTAGGLLQFFNLLSKNEADKVASCGGDAVHVVTWHGSKGLEWPMVILYSMDKESRNRLYSVNAFTDGNFSLTKPVSKRGLAFVPCPYNHRSLNSTPYGQMMQVQRSYLDAQKSTDTEWLRLLYVIFTRARDYLVFAARAGKLSTLVMNNQAICKIPQNSSDCPQGWMVANIAPVDNFNAAAKKSSRFWYQYEDKIATRTIARINPSELVYNAEQSLVDIRTVEKLWEPLSLTTPTEKEIIGTAIHNFLAVDTSSLNSNDKELVAFRILKAFDLDNLIDAQLVVQCGELCNQWISKRWPDYQRHREWPIHLQIKNVTIEGQIDLVLEGKDDFVVIDFKTAQGADDYLKKKALEYSGQMAPYAESVQEATRKKCSETIICFPLAGTIVGLKLTDNLKIIMAAI